MSDQDLHELERVFTQSGHADDGIAWRRAQVRAGAALGWEGYLWLSQAEPLLAQEHLRARLASGELSEARRALAAYAWHAPAGEGPPRLGGTHASSSRRSAEDWLAGLPTFDHALASEVYHGLLLALHDAALRGASEADVLSAREGLREAWSLLYASSPSLAPSQLSGTTKREAWSLLYASSPWVAISNAWTDLGAHLAEAVARTEAGARTAGLGTFRLTYGLIAGDLFRRLERVSENVARSLSRLFPRGEFETACVGVANLCAERALAGAV